MTDIDAKQFKDWLNARDVVCSLAVRGGYATFCIHPENLESPPQTAVSSEDLGEAIRLAQLEFDLAASSDDPNDLLDPNSFPCPECQRVVTMVRAVLTVKKDCWYIESAYGVGSLQACCRAMGLVFETEQEAREFAALCERGARER